MLCGLTACQCMQLCIGRAHGTSPPPLTVAPNAPFTAAAGPLLAPSALRPSRQPRALPNSGQRDLSCRSSGGRGGRDTGGSRSGSGSGGGGRGRGSGGGGGGGGRGKGGGKGKQADTKQPKGASLAPGEQQAGGGTPPKQPSTEPPCLVAPLRSASVPSDPLGGGGGGIAERMPAPLWGTFCGVTNGLWCGITAAYSPFTGPPMARVGRGGGGGGGPSGQVDGLVASYRLTLIVCLCMCELLHSLLLPLLPLPLPLTPQAKRRPCRWTRPASRCCCCSSVVWNSGWWWRMRQEGAAAVEGTAWSGGSNRWAGKR